MNPHQEQVLQFCQKCDQYLIAIGDNKFQQAETALKQGLEKYPQHPILIMYHSGLSFKQDKRYQAFQDIKELKYNTNLQNQQNIKEMKAKFYLNDLNIEWLKIKFQELDKILQSNEQKCFKDDEGLKLLEQTITLYFQNINKYDFTQIHRSGEEKGATSKAMVQQYRKQQTKITTQHLKNFKNAKYRKTTKQKFSQLIKSDPKNEYYYKKLVQILNTSVQAYRQAQTGIVKGGDNRIKSNMAACVSFLKSGIETLSKFPLIDAFAEMIGGISQYYLEKQADYVTTQIVQSFKDYYLPEQLVEAIIQMILHISQKKQFQQLINNPPKQYQYPWYLAVKARINGCIQQLLDLQDLVLSKMSQFKNNKYSNQENMAKAHCVQLLVVILKKQTFDKDKNLIVAAQIWLGQKLKEREQYARRQEQIRLYGRPKPKNKSSCSLF